MTHSYVCLDFFICLPWLIHECAITHSSGEGDEVIEAGPMTHSHVYVDLFMCAMTHSNCAMTYSYVCHG